MGKGEIARNKQFLLSHSVFKRFALQTHKNQGLFCKGLTQYAIIASSKPGKKIYRRVRETREPHAVGT